MARPNDIKPTDFQPSEPGKAEQRYEPPTLTELGSVRELTRGGNVAQDPDNQAMGPIPFDSTP